MRILVDMDGVIADFNNGFRKIWSNEFRYLPSFNVTKQKNFYLDKEIGNGRFKDEVWSVINRKGFFLNLPEVHGAIEGLTKLQEKYEVFICTSPMVTHDYCASEKYQWINKHLGKDWAERTILTKDKTIVKADFLIDDKFTIDETKANWKLIVFETAYSRYHNVKGYTWITIDEVL